MNTISTSDRSPIGVRWDQLLRLPNGRTDERTNGNARVNFRNRHRLPIQPTPRNDRNRWRLRGDGL